MFLKSQVVFFMLLLENKVSCKSNNTHFKTNWLCFIVKMTYSVNDWLWRKLKTPNHKIQDMFLFNLNLFLKMEFFSNFPYFNLFILKLYILKLKKSIINLPNIQNHSY